jgi:hypothetical protein
MRPERANARFHPRNIGFCFVSGGASAARGAIIHFARDAAAAATRLTPNL